MHEIARAQRFAANPGRFGLPVWTAVLDDSESAPQGRADFICQCSHWSLGRFDLRVLCRCRTAQIALGIAAALHETPPG